MAGNTKKFLKGDISPPLQTKLREAIPVTGSIVSGTYAAPDGTGTTSNIKNYTHGMFQTIFDYPYASSSANDLFDMTAGYSIYSSLDGITGEISASKKNNIYNEMSQVLVGFDQTGSIERFDKDGDLTGGAKFDEVLVLNISRLLAKDGIQKGTFNLEMGVSGGVSASHGWTAGTFSERITIKDTNGTSSYKVNSPKGEYGILYASNSQGTPLDGYTSSTQAPCGLLYYQAGVAILSASMFMPTSSGGLLSASSQASTVQTNYMLWNSASAPASYGAGSWNIKDSLTSGSLTSPCEGFRHRFYNLSFNNETILNSTMYDCIVSGRDFNYSTNPTYLSGSQIIVKNNDPSEQTPPKTFITTVGLYNSKHELMAVAKLSKPIEKNPTISVFFKVRLDY